MTGRLDETKRNGTDLLEIRMNCDHTQIKQKKTPGFLKENFMNYLKKE